MKTGRAWLIVAGILVLVSTLLPLWGMTMIAPQYPGGLHVHAYPGKIQGDLSIINVLNHYVGMQALHAEDFVQVLMLPYLFAIIGIGLIIAGVTRKRTIAAVMIALLLLTALGGVVELRRTLIAYGTELDPAAPLDMEPFVPPIIGHYVVWNFDIHHSFMAGTYLLFVATIVAVVGFRQLGQALPLRKRDQTGGKMPTKKPSDDGSAKQAGVVGMCLIAATILASSATGTHAMGSSPVSDNLADGVQQSARSIPSTLPSKGAPAEVIVTPGGSMTLSEALATVVDGGTVRLQPGVYEGPFVVDRGVTLIADKGPQPAEIIGEGELVVVVGPSSLIGLTVRHTGRLIRSDEAAVRLRGHGATVAGNIIEFDTAHGIYVERGGHHTISGNNVIGFPGRAIDDRGNGLFLFDTKGNAIRDNWIEDARDGIYLSFAGDDTITGNTVASSRYGIHSMYSGAIVYESNHLFKNIIGSAFMYSENMTVVDNVIFDHVGHRGYGILLKDGNRNRLVDNYIVGNNLGLFLDLSDDNEIEGNVFAANSMAMEIFSSSERNRVVGNAFIGNRVDTLLNIGRHSNVWWTEQSGGNYWDTYRGVDIDGHGFGALPHTSADAFGFLTRNNPELAAFYMGPAVEALAWAEQAFPLLNVPRVTDERPLVRPDSATLADMRRQLTHSVQSLRDSGVVSETYAIAVFGLVVAGLALFRPLFRPVGVTGSRPTTTDGLRRE